MKKKVIKWEKTIDAGRQTCSQDCIFGVCEKECLNLSNDVEAKAEMVISLIVCLESCQYMQLLMYLG